MEQEQILAILYEMAIVIGGEIRLEQLLTKTLQRLLFHTAFPCGMLFLDTEQILSPEYCQEFSDVRLETSIGDFELARLNKTTLHIPTTLLRGGFELGETPELLGFLPCRKDYYTVFLRLPIDECGVILLLAPRMPGTGLPLTRIFQPVLSNLAKAILLCRSNDAYTQRIITDRQIAEAALQDLSTRNRLILDSVGEGICGLDRDGNATFVNPAAAKMLGFTPEELAGYPMHEILNHRRFDGTSIPLEDCPVYRTITENRQFRVSEDMFKRADGTSFPVEYVSTPLRDNGDVMGAVIVFQDISERKRAEENDRLLSAIVRSSDEAIIAIDLDGIILSWNRGSEKVYGYSAAKAIGRPVSMLIPPDHPDELVEILSGIKGGGQIEQTTERIRKDGQRICISLTVSPICDGAGNIVGASSIAHDDTLRRVAEEALRSSEARLKEAQRLARVGSWELDLVTNVLLWSDEIYRIFEIDPTRFDASYEAFLETIHPDDRNAVNTAYTDSVANRTPYSIEHRLLFPDGRIKHVHEQCETHYAANGKPLLSIGAVQDITERKLAEEVIRKAGAYNRNLIEASLDPLVTIGPDGRITDVNAATESVTGYPREKLIGTDFSDYFTDPEKARTAYRQAFQEGLVHDYPLEIRHREGQVTSVLYNASVYRDKDGQIVGVFAAARDITERLKGEKTMRLLSSIVEYSDDAIIGKSLEGIIASWNKGAEKMFGYEKNEVVGKPISILIPDERKDEEALFLEKIRQGEHIEHFETLRRRKDGRLLYVSLTISPIIDAEERVVGASTIARDITEHKQAEEALHKLSLELEQKVRDRTAELEAKNAELEAANAKLLDLDRLKSMFIASMSHELRTPLNSIIGFSSIIHDEWIGPVNPEQKENLDTIQRSGKHLLNLINDVIDVSKIEAGKIEARFEEFDLYDLLTEAVQYIEKDIRDKGLELQLDIHHHPLCSDRRRLLQSVINLLSNAVKFTEHGMVTLSSAVADIEQGAGDQHPSVMPPPLIDISIGDSGIGIAGEDIPRLFQPFVRLESSLKTTVPGTGLGLYLTRKLVVEVLGGDIMCKSNVGMGTTFTLRIPERIHEKSTGNRG